MSELLSLLKNTSFFKGLCEESHKVLEEVGKIKKFSKNETLFIEGQQGEGFFLLSKGHVQLFKTSWEGKEVVIKTLSKGEWFAEVVLFEKDTYPVSALALDKVEAYFFPKSSFIQLLKIESFQKDFFKLLMSKQRYLTQRIFYLTAHDVEERFYQFLREQYGVREKYELKLKKKDIASAISTNNETFSRMLSRIQNEGKIEWLATKTFKLKKAVWEQYETE